eukprot:337122-Pelagomonas_calceolata.AAC.5
MQTQTVTAKRATADAANKDRRVWRIRQVKGHTAAPSWEYFKMHWTREWHMAMAQVLMSINQMPPFLGRHPERAFLSRSPFLLPRQ